MKNFIADIFCYFLLPPILILFVWYIGALTVLISSGNTIELSFLNILEHVSRIPNFPGNTMILCIGIVIISTTLLLECLLIALVGFLFFVNRKESSRIEYIFFLKNIKYALIVFIVGSLSPIFFIQIINFLLDIKLIDANSNEIMKFGLVSIILSQFFVALFFKVLFIKKRSISE